MQRGTLFLVVGPSGAGKDSLLDAAKTALTNDPRFHFPRRLITRPADAGGENHIDVTAAEFERLANNGQLLLAWRAHDLHYGIPDEVEDTLANGQHAVVNVSRSVLDEARARLQPVRVLSIHVPTEILRQRLVARGREKSGDVERRLQRAAAFEVAGRDVTTISNDADLETAIQRFLAALAA